MDQLYNNYLITCWYCTNYRRPTWSLRIRFIKGF